MSFLFNNRGVSHLTFPVTDSETELRIPWPDFNSFMRSNARSGDLMYAILRGPIEREIVAIDLINSFSGTTDKYLKVIRGQGGTSSMDWPAGTLLFISTHADHYNACFQPDGTRQVDFNPNAVLSPNYAGEKVFQFAGCAVRWWQSFDAVSPYWHLIAGEPCLPQEEFVNPTGSFLSKVWLVTTPPCWAQQFDDTFWEPDAGSAIWTGSQWENNPPDTFLQILPIGIWSDGYRPQLMKVYRPVEGFTNVTLRKEPLVEMVNFPNLKVGPTGRMYEIPSDHLPAHTPAPFDADISRFDMSGFVSGKVALSNLEFFDCEKEEVIPIADGHIHGPSGPDYDAVRNAATGQSVFTTLTSSTQQSYRSNVGAFNYNIARTFMYFDLSGITITDVREVLLAVQCKIVSTNNARCIQQSSAGGPPLTVGDYGAVAGQLLADQVGPFVFNNRHDFWFNDYGINLVESYVGIGTLIICMRDYDNDFISNPPPMTAPKNTTTASRLDNHPNDMKPTLKIFGKT